MGIWGSDYDVYWQDDFDFSGYFKKVKEETTWIKKDLNIILKRSGWTTLSQDQIHGILSSNVKRLLEIR